jgi:hypothetical protein
MHAYQTVLFLHLLSVFVMVGGITVVGLCYFRLRAAMSVMDAAPWVNLADQTGWVFPVSILALFASGAYLTSDRWTWSTSWIDVSIVGLALVTLQGPLIAGPRAKAVKQALDENASGALDERARRLTHDPALWIILLANPGIVLGITWNMCAKPGIAEAIAAVVAGYAVGVLAAWPLTKQAAREPTASTG